MNAFDITRATRKNVLKLIDGLTPEQLNTIPEGFKNNIIWQVGHVMATQQLLTYGLTNNEFVLTEEIIEDFRKGTAPKGDIIEDDIEGLKQAFLDVIDLTEEDYKDDVLTEFTPYETSFGITLETLEDAITFNNVHEGLHMGIIMAMKKLV